MIGIIDSGSGGQSVIEACKQYFNEDYIYIFDDLNCPYGNKPKEVVRDIVKRNIEYLIRHYDLDFIILACNTASSLIYTYELNYRIPILKTNPNLDCLNNGEKTLLFATKNTIENNKKVKFNLYNYDNLMSVYIKDFPKLIDNYLTYKNEENKNKILNKLKSTFCYKNRLKKRYRDIKYLSLGCTHFKYIEGFLCDIFSEDIEFVECEKETALNALYLLRKNKQKNTVKIIRTSEIFMMNNE